jgi:hypothetical protein
VDGFPSGQRGQTVNLLATPSKVRILLHPLAEWLDLILADVAQLAEQLICNQQVIGSSPIIGFKLNIAGWSSLEARRAHNPKVAGSNPAPATRTFYVLNAQIAQLVEQRTENPRVTGSIPVLGILFLAKFM